MNQAQRILSTLRLIEGRIREKLTVEELAGSAYLSRYHYQRLFRQAVGEAQVVLTNPTHFAVALRYDHGRDQAPVVVAKGRGATALAIRKGPGGNHRIRTGHRPQPGL